MTHFGSRAAGGSFELMCNSDSTNHARSGQFGLAIIIGTPRYLFFQTGGEVDVAWTLTLFAASQDRSNYCAT